jgi:hypothetical protein
MLRLPHYLDSRLKDGGKVVSLTRRPRFTPQENYIPYVLGCTQNHSASSFVEILNRDPAQETLNGYS